MGHRCSIHCLVPPIVRDHIATKGDAEQRRAGGRDVAALPHDPYPRGCRTHSAPRVGRAKGRTRSRTASRDD